MRDKTANNQKAIEKIREFKQGAQIICLQELFSSLYFCDVESYDNFKLAEPIPGETSNTLASLAKELGVVIIASLFEKRAEGLYHNTTAVLDADGAYLGKYRKMHIPDDPSYYENFILRQVYLVYKVFQNKFATIWRFDIVGTNGIRSCTYYEFNGCGNVILSNRHWLGNIAG